MGNAYAEIGLLFLMYRVCSLCLVSIDLLIDLHMNYCNCYTWVYITRRNLCWS